jgi:hypothetical protein
LFTVMLEYAQIHQDVALDFASEPRLDLTRVERNERA